MPTYSSQTRTKRPAPKRPVTGSRALRGAEDTASAADMAFNTPAAPSMRPPVRSTTNRTKAPARRATPRHDRTPRGFGAVGIMAAIALSIVAGLGAGTAVQAAIGKNQVQEILVQAPVRAQDAAFTF